MPNHAGPNTKGEENLVFGYDLGDSANSFPGIPAVNCSRVPTTSGNGNGTGNWTVTEITDGSIIPPRKGARVFKFVAGTTSNLYRQANYYAGGGFSNNNPQNSLILGKTSPSNFTTVSEANKYRWGFWVRGEATNNAGWGFNIDIGDRGGASYTVGNKTDWYFINCVNDLGIASTTYPYDFFDIFSSNQGLTMYVADMGIMRAPGTVDSLPIMQAYPQWVDYGQERSYTAGLKDLTGNSTIDLTNVSFDSNAQMTFDGTGDYVDLGSDVIISPNNQGWTAEYVFNTNSASTLQHFNSAEADDFNANWLALLSNYLAVWDHGQGTWRYGSTQFISNTWYHIAFVQTSSTTMQFYVNGQPEGGNHTSFSWSPTYSALKTRYIGRYEYNGGYGGYFNGEIPITKLYNRALTASEIKANYNAIKGRFNI